MPEFPSNESSVTTPKGGLRTMKQSRIRAVSRTNTFLLLCKKVASATGQNIEAVTAKSDVPEVAFRSLVSRREVQKTLKEMTHVEYSKVEWHKSLTTKELLDLLWPPSKKKKK